MAKPAWWAAGVLVLLGAAALVGQEPPAPPDPVVVALVVAHNKERAKEKLPPLKLAPLLEVAAKAHARDMAEREVMSHEGADGSTPSQRIRRAGYKFQTAGENVAQGYREVPAVMQGWIDSPPHKKNILGDFTEIGVARVEAKNGKPYWSAEFGKPLPHFEPGEAAAGLFKRLNGERTTAKLPALVLDPKLAKAAQDQAAEFARTKGKATPTFDGIDQKAYRELAMTNAAGQPDPESVVKTLLESPDHKSKILGKLTRVGVGFATAEEDGMPFWCVILALPANR